MARAPPRITKSAEEPATLHRENPTGRQHRKLDGAAEARLVAVACSEPPTGRSRWAMKLLADKLVEPEVVEAIDPAAAPRSTAVG